MVWFINQPVGWREKTRQRIYRILNGIDNHVQKLNNRFTNPSGTKTPEEAATNNAEPIKSAE